MENKMYKLFLFAVLVLSVSFLIAGLVMAPDYFLKYSPDGILKETTLEKIKTLRVIVFSMAFIFVLVLITALFFKKKFSNYLTKNRSIIINVLTLISALIIFFILTEITLRWLIGNETSSAGVGPGSIKFNEEYVKLNDDYMRDTNFSLHKPENTLRIAAVGDSVTFGSGIKNVSDVYSKLLEKKLNS